MEESSEVCVPKRKRSQVYPAPLVFEASQQHQQSFIVLHGRGSNADTFGPALLRTTLPNGQTVKDALPHTKFVFPSASFRRATVFKRIAITQWFDNYSIKDTSERQELQIEGLRETVTFIHSLIRQEAEIVGLSNIVLGGLSQGCAAMLISLLLWEGPPIQAAFGMSGWLPFCNVLMRVEEDTASNSDDFFGSIDDVASKIETKPQCQYAVAVQSLREELDMASDEFADVLQVPVFIGHGVEDEKVPVERGREAAASLKQLGCQASWHEYEGLGHWYSGEELADILRFVEAGKDVLQ